MAYQSSINISSVNSGSIAGANQENAGANRRDSAQQQMSEWNTARQNAASTNAAPSGLRPTTSPDIHALLNLHKPGLQNNAELNGRQQAALHGLMSNISTTITHVEQASNKNIALGKDGKEANNVRLVLDQVGFLLNQLLERLTDHGGKSKKRRNRNILGEEADSEHESVVSEEEETHLRLTAFAAIPGILVKISAALKRLHELIRGSDKEEATMDVSKDISKVIDQTNHYVSDKY